MMASLLSPAAPNPPRLSQVLPTVKCSSCNLPVPLSELGDHVCPKPPPVPTLPKPSVSPAQATSLLPERLQGRVASPAPAPRPPPVDALSRHSSPRPQIPPGLRSASPSNDRLRINTASSGPSSFQQRPSPLSRSGLDATSPTSPRERNNSSPVLSRPPINPDSRARTPSNPDTRAGTPFNADPRVRRPSNAAHSHRPRAPSNAGSISGRSIAGPVSPHAPRPPPVRNFSGSQSPQHVQAPPRQMSRVPYSEAGIDTKSGGEAGMAGVGRRGFAAAARAAMFVGQTDRSFAAPPGRRLNAPGHLDLDPSILRTDTPPLSPASSSHSPGVSPFPQSPGPVPLPSSPKANLPAKTPVPPTSPIGSVRMPFFEKFRNQLPGGSAPDANTVISHNTPSSNINTPSTATPSRNSQSTIGGSLYRSESSNSSAPRQSHDRDERPASPSSESEYGLAYANSTDYEDEADEDKKNTRSSKANPPPPLPLTTSILRSGSTANSNHVRFPSASERSGIRIPSANKGHDRNDSASSLSSISSAGDKSERSNSALIAHALGLSRTPPSSYGKLGGPGATMGGRTGRSLSGSSSSGRSAYSRGSGALTGTGTGVMEKQVATLLEEASNGDAASVKGLAKSKSTSRQRTFGLERDDSASMNHGLDGPIPHRSNTVPAPHSPEARSPKLPVRSKTSNEKVTEAERQKIMTRRNKTCLKCNKKIEDGRWVQVDAGGVLCEKCWKSMYLPKCRRCTLPIEKHAVSSSDGQLKGKYHKECFNCHICHKPFPDKSFYVFDGKPLCAYHYHEANDSLCAAAHCGQPIEGPCAVSHAGDRYHPEHMTCEYPGRCKEILKEYWEVDGRMLCERHAHASRVGSDEEREDDWAQSSKSTKRVTRFIDLTSLGGSGLR